MLHCKALLWEFTTRVLPFPHLQRLPYCNIIARPLHNIRPATDPPFSCHTPYNIGDGNIGLTSSKGQPAPRSDAGLAGCATDQPPSTTRLVQQKTQKESRESLNTTTNSVDRQNQTHAASHTICGLCVPRRRCPVVPLSLRLKRESELQPRYCVLTESNRRDLVLR